MVAMLRSIHIIATALVLASCASSPARLALHSAREPSEELQCMTECLEDGSEDCEDCVSQCLKGPGDSVASRD
jgi:hypothetical protein